MAFEVTADTAAFAYATTDAAVERAERVVGGAAFVALSDEEQEQHLNTASADLDTLDWIGERASADQELEWPRTGTDYSSDAWPQRLVEATIALAWANAATLAADAAADLLNPADTSNIKREKTGPLETEYFDRAASATTSLDRLPSHVQRLIAPLIRVVSTSAWGSATVSRAS